MAGVSAVRQSSYTEELSFFYKNAYDDFFGKEHEFLTLDSSLPKDMQVSFLTGVQRCAGGKEREIVRKALKALVVTLVRERDDLQIENLRLQVERRASKVVLRSTCGPAPVRGRAGAVAADVRGDAGWQASQAGGRFTARGVGEELRRVKRRKGRRNLANFESQPVTTHVYELSEEERACPCCGLERKVIGSDEIWQIEYFPGHFERLRHVRKKHAGPACEHNGENRRMETAAKPRDGVREEAGRARSVGVHRYQQVRRVLPLYRLEDVFARQSFEISRTTQSVWRGDMGDLFEPLWEPMAERVRAWHVVATDDTIMPMLRTVRSSVFGRVHSDMYEGDA
jgi:transposase